MSQPSALHSVPPISLLWPPDRTPPTHRINLKLSASTANDLDLDRVSTALSAAYGYAPRIRSILLELCDDPAVIRYRQAVFADLVETPDLVAGLVETLPHIHALDSFTFGGFVEQSALHEVVWRLGQLESFVDCVTGISRAFTGLEDQLQSAGLRRLYERVTTIQSDELFQNLTAALPNLLVKVRGITSVTIGVNLDSQLRPEEATLLAINNRRFRGNSSPFFQMLFGRKSSDEWEGLAPLHSAKRRDMPPMTPDGLALDNPLLVPLFRDLADVLKRISRPVAAALKHYAQVNTRFMNDIGAEMAFLLSAVDLVRTLTAHGLPMCRPEIVENDERICQIENSFNLNLALRLITRHGERPLNGALVLNDVNFGPEGRIFVLTGPNQGGKTTYTQLAGLLHVLAQAGLYVPGTHARISPVDNIYTHFPVEEQPDAEAGRLGEEAKRLSDIFAHATRHSLVLLNESLASTSPGEGLYLARDIVRILRALGTRCIYATHLHELATGCDHLNRNAPGDSRVVSLVSHVGETNGTGDVRQTYRILPGPPQGRSYAREIAARYGISYDQLADVLRARGVIAPPDHE